MQVSLHLIAVYFRVFSICLFYIVFFALSLFACKREYDSPPLNQLPENGIISIAQLRSMAFPHKFVGDTSIFGVITMDEQTGNIYKNVYIQDTSGAGMNLRLLSSGGVIQGDSVRVSLKGTILTQFDGMLQLDSVDVDDNIVTQSTGNIVEPKTVTIAEINSSIQAQLIRLEGVEFSGMDVGGTWADGDNQASLNRMLVNCFGDEVIVRILDIDYGRQRVQLDLDSIDTPERQAWLAEQGHDVDEYEAKLAGIGEDAPATSEELDTEVIPEEEPESIEE